ncbi:acyl-CoA dehydratase activase [Chrysiogenes arsenatis]|uniref:acyl-CoA dehydratase activase n=1 Tax=Chrysiogenes arsenatis TaxID=309797 RepID=UPI0004150F2F|nr:acyl-CoA dehydratase activase [Chrysiogenes arsenatis]
MYSVGIDVGSVSINAIILNRQRQIVFELPYRRHFGHTKAELRVVFSEILERYSVDTLDCITFTGTQSMYFASLLGMPHEVETIAQVAGTVAVMPGVRSIIAMGGQDAALFEVGYHPDGRWFLDSFVMNGPCASGTGSFIDQQAERLAGAMYGEAEASAAQERQQKLLEDFIALGKQAKYPAAVACRCTVFTKSDMIHLQNKGEPLANIISGLHAGNAANYVSTLVAGRALHAPIAFIGGMASNALQVQAFSAYFPDIVVPPLHCSLGALGAALLSLQAGTRAKLDVSCLDLDHGNGQSFPLTEPLTLQYSVFDPSNVLERSARWDEPVAPKAFLGIDIGSTSTKYALIDEHGALLHKCYRPTQGKPIEVVQQLLMHLWQETGGYFQLQAIATTGSGRNVIGDFVSADVILDEITAHARGALAMDDTIDTIFEIGGQDSKYIAIENGSPVDFVMNKVCAAGTGSFLHELANKMGINIFGEFQEIALDAKTPIALAERCTVFMESDMAGYAQKGASRHDLIAGLCYAIVHNYLHRVVEKRHVGERIMFLGGPSLNKGIVAAFERVLERPILVPRHREVMGAYGAALVAREQAPAEPKVRNLPSLFAINVSARESICRAEANCHNECKLKTYQFGERRSVWGGDCGRYETTHHDAKPTENYFALRHALFLQALAACHVHIVTESTVLPTATKPRIGVPLALHMLDWGVFWVHLLHALGFEVVLTAPTNGNTVQRGIETMSSETCFPVKVFHGHVDILRALNVPLLFLPNVINMPSAPEEQGYLCPLVESSQFMVKAALSLGGAQIIAPTVHLKDGADILARRLCDVFPQGMLPSLAEVQAASRAAWEAQAAFEQSLMVRGKEILGQIPAGEPLWIITGRPYNLYDERLNLQVGKQFSKLGIRALPMDFLEVASEDLSDFPRMYWGLGARILKTARLTARTPHWYGVHITNFSCGADSFLEHFYHHIMGQKPSLILELDEHSAAAGIVTRIEAFRNVVRNWGDEVL